MTYTYVFSVRWKKKNNINDAVAYLATLDDRVVWNVGMYVDAR